MPSDQPNTNFFGYDPLRNPIYDCVDSDHLEKICDSNLQALASETGLSLPIARTLMAQANWDKKMAEQILYDSPFGQQMLEAAG